jgi:hypothetical protein
MMDDVIYLDLADQIARNFGNVDAEIARKISGRMRRKFSVTVSREIIFSQALHFREIYQFASSILTECLKPSSDGYAHPDNVDAHKYMALLTEKFPQERNDILKTISGWVVYYEYLR